MENHAFHGSRHLWIMVLCCLIPVAALTAIFALKIPVSQVLTFGLILLCPLSHFLLMGLMGRDRHEHGEATRSTANTAADNRQPSTQQGSACH